MGRLKKVKKKMVSAACLAVASAFVTVVALTTSRCLHETCSAWPFLGAVSVLAATIFLWSRVHSLRPRGNLDVEKEKAPTKEEILAGRVVARNALIVRQFGAFSHEIANVFYGLKIVADRFDEGDRKIFFWAAEHIEKIRKLVADIAPEILLEREHSAASLVEEIRLIARKQAADRGVHWTVQANLGVEVVGVEKQSGMDQDDLLIRATRFKELTGGAYLVISSIMETVEHRISALIGGGFFVRFDMETGLEAVVEVSRKKEFELEFITVSVERGDLKSQSTETVPTIDEEALIEAAAMVELRASGWDLFAIRRDGKLGGFGIRIQLPSCDSTPHCG